MTGLEKNVHAVGLACYAPMFANVDYVNWRPDMIWFDNHQVYGSVNYYVQSMFMRHQGTHRLDFTVTEPELEQTARLLAEQKIRESAKTISGPIRLLVNEGQGVFFEVTVKNHDTGKLHRFTDCVCGTESENRAVSYENAVEVGVIPKDWTNYTLTMKAKETEGKKGFLVYLGEESDHMLWTLGGWQNLDISMEHFKNGRGACLSEAMFSAEKDHEYELMLVVKDRTMKIYVDGEEYLDTIDKIPVPKQLYVSAALDEATGDVIVKAVNITGNSQTAQLALDGVNGTHNVLVEKMAAALSYENTMENKKCVVPAVSEETIPDGTFTRTFEPYSLTILRIRQ
jgi:alpha-L-arabinofuranosidase